MTCPVRPAADVDSACAEDDRFNAVVTATTASPRNDRRDVRRSSKVLRLRSVSRQLVGYTQVEDRRLSPAAARGSRNDRPILCGGYLAQMVRTTLLRMDPALTTSLAHAASVTAGDAFASVDELERGLREQRYVAERGLATTLYLTLK